MRRGELPLVSVADRADGRSASAYARTGEAAWVGHSGGYRIQVLTAGGPGVTGLAAAGPADGTSCRWPDTRSNEERATWPGWPTASGRVLRFALRTPMAGCSGWRDRNGFSYRYSYDELGRCVAGSGPGGTMSARFSYGDRVTWWTDACGAVTIYQLDASSG